MSTVKQDGREPTSDAGSRSVTTCRICRSTSLYRYLELGSTPLANSYLTEDQRGEPEFSEELALQVCLDCGLSQLTKVVDRDRMFRDYLYVSSTPATFREHCTEVAGTLVEAVGAAPGETVLDIASNDGCLLSSFKPLGLKVVGVDPATNLAAEANANGIPTLNEYWSVEVAGEVVERFGRPRIITATNVFAHVDDLHAFLLGVEACLAPHGIFVVEAPYVLTLLEHNEFDTAYHEHLSYLGITPLARLFTEHGLPLFRVQFFPDLHGGTVRVWTSRQGDYEVEFEVGQYLEREAAAGIRDVATYDAFRGRVELIRDELRELLTGLRNEGKVIWGYGASAKGNTLANYVGITPEIIPCVVDDNPKKWGYYTPGSQMRIVPTAELGGAESPDLLLLLAWNFEREIRRRSREAGFAGRHIVPVPQPSIVD